MNRRRHDLDGDLDDTLFDREAAEQRKRDREDRLALAKERREQEETQDRAIRDSAKASMFSATEEAILAEYRAAGVEPRPGTLVSLALLRRMGWTIEEVEHGRRQLVAPPTPPAYAPKQRENS